MHSFHYISKCHVWMLSIRLKTSIGMAAQPSMLSWPSLWGRRGQQRRKVGAYPVPPAGSWIVVSPLQQEVVPAPLTSLRCKLNGDFICDNYKIFQYIYSFNKCLNSQAWLHKEKNKIYVTNDVATVSSPQFLTVTKLFYSYILMKFSFWTIK